MIQIFNLDFSPFSLFVPTCSLNFLNSYICPPDLELEAAIPMESKKSKKRQAASDPDLPTTTEEVDFGKNYNPSSC